MTPIERQILKNQQTILRILSKELDYYVCRKCKGENVSEHGLSCKEELINSAQEKTDELLNPTEDKKEEPSCDMEETKSSIGIKIAKFVKGKKGEGK